MEAEIQEQQSKSTLHSFSINKVQTILKGWSPLIGLLIMGLVSFIIHTMVANPVYELLPKDQGEFAELVPSFAEILAMLLWSITVVFFSFTALVMVAAIIRVILERRDNLRELFPYLLFAILLVAGAVIFLKPVQTHDFNEKLLGSTVYVSASNVRHFVSGIQILSLTILLGLAVSLSILITRVGRYEYNQEGISINKRVKNLANDQRNVRMLLYLVALVLVGGTLQVVALYSWAEIRMSEITSTSIYYFSQVAGIPAKMGVLNGIFYSILLAVIFTPAFVRLNTIALQLADEAKPDESEEEKHKWLEKHSASTSLTKHLFSGLAVVSPMVAGGPLVYLFDLIIR